MSINIRFFLYMYHMGIEETGRKADYTLYGSSFVCLPLGRQCLYYMLLNFKMFLSRRKEMRMKI